jgi:hypothetical protein
MPIHLGKEIGGIEPFPQLGRDTAGCPLRVMSSLVEEVNITTAAARIATDVLHRANPRIRA